ncbi:MAG: VTT domain-containing protein [Vicinamibacteria bacterium]|nr:VTT domain-containing protein [Vicinamibacteria bacterium]
MHDLIIWIQDVAVPKLGWFGMFLVAAADSSFVSLPEVSDLLIVTGAAKDPGIAWEFVLATALGSMVGCLALYEVGRRGGERLATRFVSPHKLLKAESLLAKYGAFAIAIPALSPPPMPFKGFVLAAGIFAMPRGRFVVTVFFARGLRYVIWAILGAEYGDDAIGWLKNLDVWVQNHLLIVGASLVLFVLAFALWWRSHHVPPAEALPPPV